MALFGSVEELLKYVKPGTRLAKGLSFLKDFREGRHPDVEKLARSQKAGDNVRVEIDGNKLFAMVQAYAPRARDQGKFEAHRDYTDLQYLCEGKEWIEVCDLKSQKDLPPYNNDGNLFFPLGGEPHSRIKLQSGFVAVLFPNDSHAPCMRIDEADGLVRKIVLKVQHSDSPSE